MDYKKLTDTELISLYINQNEVAFKHLFNRHKSRVFTTCFLIVKDRDIANDLCQDVFFKVIDTLREGRYKEGGKFQAWIVRIAHNMSIDYYRKHAKRIMIRDSEEYSIIDNLQVLDVSAHILFERKEIKSLLKQYIQELSVEQKQVLIMRQFAGMSFQEIAEFTGVSINTALGRMRYALINLRKKLKPHFAYEQQLYN